MSQFASSVSMRSASLRLIPIAAFAAFAALPARAQTGDQYSDPEHNKDYYSVIDKNLLRTVEAYHLRQGDEKMRAKRYAAAQGDFDFILNYYPNHPQALLLMADPTLLVICT